MKFIALTLAFQSIVGIIPDGTKYKNSTAFAHKFEAHYYKVDQVNQILGDVRVEVYNPVIKQYFYEGLCDIKLESGDLVYVRDSCETVVKQLNGEQ